MKKIDWRRTFEEYLPPVGVFFLWVCILAAHGLVATYDRPWQLFGERTYATLDSWTPQHFLSGVLVGQAVLWLAKRWSPEFAAELRKDVSLFACLVLTLLLTWEGGEVYMDNGNFGAEVAAWKIGYEHWSNRAFGDPLVGLCGALIARRWPRAWLVAIVPCTIWAFVNYVVLPDSMYAQRWIATWLGISG